jgi:type IV secretion system protein VirB9
MRALSLTFAAAWLGLVAGPSPALGQEADPRLKEIFYDPLAVVTIPVKRGVVTHVMLDAGEVITDVGSGLGADCSKPEASWCIAAQAGSRNIFVKPKSIASTPNNLAVVTDKRTHAFRFVLLPDGDPRQPIYRLSVKVATPPVSAAPVARTMEAPAAPALAPHAAEPVVPAGDLIAERLAAAPAPVNSNYSIAEGAASQDIVPTLIFDDGRFTYLRFPSNREVPAVFHVLGDGSETLVNARMEDDLLVVDRVSRGLMLRAGPAVVGVWNEAFDPDGIAPDHGTTAPGVQRDIKATPRTTQSNTASGGRHD